LRRWFVFVETAYCDTEYHNATHAADVLQTVHFMLSTAGAKEFLSDLQICALLIGAVVHDLGHDGLNNSFHKNALSDRALRYNDLSVQENFHISTFFCSMKADPAIDIMKTMSPSSQAEMRRLLIALVLATDMSKHFHHQKELKGLLEQHQGHDVDAWTGSDLDSLMCAVLHAADISNPAKPLPTARMWADRCLAEFFKQGRREKELGLVVSPSCDPDNTVLHQTQIGFIQFIVLPWFKQLASLLPKLEEICVPVLEGNLAYWQSMAETTPPT